MSSENCDREVPSGGKEEKEDATEPDAVIKQELGSWLIHKG